MCFDCNDQFMEERVDCEGGELMEEMRLFFFLLLLFASYMGTGTKKNIAIAMSAVSVVTKGIDAIGRLKKGKKKILLRNSTVHSRLRLLYQHLDVVPNK